MTSLFTKDRVRTLPIDKIEPNTSQPRRVFDEASLAELARSIGECGLIQPITVRKTAFGYQIIAGERRWRACHLAGLKEIPCIVSEATDERAALIAITENVQRKDLDVFEEALGIQKMIELSGLSQEQAARKLGKSQSAVANKLRLLKLDHMVIATVKKNGLTERHARALLKITDRETQRRAVEEIVRRELNVSQTEAFVERLLEPKKTSGQKKLLLIKDIRLLMNTLTNAVDTVKSAGIDAAFVQSEDEDAITVTIKIPKKKQAKEAG